MVLWCLGLTIVCLAAGGGLLSLVEKEPMDEDVPMFILHPEPAQYPFPVRRPRTGQELYPMREFLSLPDFEETAVVLPGIEGADYELHEYFARCDMWYASYPQKICAAENDAALWSFINGVVAELMPARLVGADIHMTNDMVMTAPCGTDVSCYNLNSYLLVSTFYDLKQTSSGVPTGMNPDLCKKVLSDFNSSGWSKSVLAKYYQAPTKLYAPCFYMPICKAEEAPYAYKVQDKVKASMWVVIYRGKVKAPKSGRFRFIGLGDDCLAVRFNGRTVFDYGVSSVVSGKMPGGNAANRDALRDGQGQFRQFFKYSGVGSEWNDHLDGLCTGDVFEVEEGQKYPIEILISEVSGGYFGFVLLIEDMDEVPKKKDASGAPIFQLFRVHFVEPNAQEIYQNMHVPGDLRSDIPYDRDSLIWEVKG